MAQKVTVALEDDLDGGPAEQTVRFAYEGTEYEIGDADSVPSCTLTSRFTRDCSALLR